MSQPKKSTTLVERFGFKDSDLTTPKHDEIVLSLTKEKILTILHTLNIAQPSNKIEEYWWSKLSMCNNLPCGHHQLRTLIEDPKMCGNHQFSWNAILDTPDKNREFARLAQKNGALKEYCRTLNERIEKIIQHDIPTDYEKITKIVTIPEVKIIHEYPITNGPNKFIIGFIDLRVHLSYPELKTDYHICNESRYTIYIEVKTTIPSYGELVRQMRMYQSDGVILLVVSPDDRFASALREQGIYFYKWE